MFSPLKRRCRCKGDINVVFEILSSRHQVLVHTVPGIVGSITGIRSKHLSFSFVIYLLILRTVDLYFCFVFRHCQGVGRMPYYTVQKMSVSGKVFREEFVVSINVV